MKTVKVSSVVFEMLLELSKKRRLKSDLLLDKLIREEYKNNR